MHAIGAGSASLHGSHSPNTNSDVAALAEAETAQSVLSIARDLYNLVTYDTTTPYTCYDASGYAVGSAQREREGGKEENECCYIQRAVDKLKNKKCLLIFDNVSKTLPPEEKKITYTDPLMANHAALLASFTKKPVGLPVPQPPVHVELSDFCRRLLESSPKLRIISTAGTHMLDPAEKKVENLTLTGLKLAGTVRLFEAHADMTVGPAQGHKLSQLTANPRGVIAMAKRVKNGMPFDDALLQVGFN